ncbi:MmyB family transcriptional regulator [Cellulomonas hominis]
MNLLRMIFRRDDTNASFGDHPARVLSETTQYRADLVADLRAAVGRYPGDPALAALVADLQAQSPEVGRLWGRGDVARHDSTRKVVSHPSVTSPSTATRSRSPAPTCASSPTPRWRAPTTRSCSTSCA